MADGLDQSRSQPSPLRTAIWLCLFVVAAFALRSAFTSQESFDAESQRHTFTGNDPYYHWRTVTHVINTGSNLNFDTMFNAPEGNWNPNPPLWTWTTAPVAQLFKGLGVGGPDYVGTALNTMVAVWGALCVIPVYMIAKDLWGRRAGLWAGFFMAVSAPAIQRSVWGYADHDAISMFFILLGIAFLVRGFLQMQASATYVQRWSSGGSIASGVRQAVAANRNTLLYAVLAGLAISACAVTWKGYPYALATLAVAALVQMVLDHWRNRDGTVTWLVYLITTGIAAILPYLLYYQAIPQHVDTTVQPSLYVLAGVFAAGLVLVPTRNLPSILVFPALLVGGILAFVFLYFYMQDVWYIIFSGLGYFDQSKLYSTIAEAQRPSIGEVAANLGFFTFLAAFLAIGHAVKRAYKGQAAFILVASWAVVSAYLMFAAHRFITNAAPVFAVLLGYVMVRFMDWARTSDVRKRFRAGHGQNPVGRTFRSLTFRSVAVVGIVFLLFVLPNVWIGTDAGMGPGFAGRHGLLDTGDCTVRGNCGVHFGGFGIDFELQSNGWLEAMRHLATLDTHLPETERPMFMAWWDYGHWATGIGMHPTVADPFQSHYEISGRFLASDSEAEAMQWLSLLLLTGDWQANLHSYSAPVKQLLETKYPNVLAQLNPGYWYDPQIKVLRDNNITGEKAFTFYDELVVATGHSVGYFGVDDKMGPFHTASEVSRETSGIFYAPVFLANKNPDAYVKTQMQAGNQIVQVVMYEPDPDGGFRRIPERFVGSDGQEWVLYNNLLYRQGQTPPQGGRADDGLQISLQYYEPTPLYANTMFARSFGGVGANSSAPGDGLSHWRAIHQTLKGEYTNGEPARRVVLLQYYKGVTVTGKVLDDAGAPMAGASVAFVDSFGARHGTSAVKADGTFSAVAPFSQGDDIRVHVLGKDGSLVMTAANDTVRQFTLADTQAGLTVSDVTITVPRGTITGIAFENKDGVAGYNATTDMLLEGARITTTGAAPATSDASGAFSIGPVQAGDYTLSVSLADYNNGTFSARVESGKTANVEAGLLATPSRVSVRYLDFNGTGIAGIPLVVDGKGAASYTDANGNATMTIAPGTHTVAVQANWNVTKAAGGPKEFFHGSAPITVPYGGKPMELVVSREQPTDR